MQTWTRRSTAVFTLLALLAAVALLAAACGGGETTTTAAPATTAGGTTETTAATGTTTEPAGGPIKVGVIASLTGSAAAPVSSVMNGLKLEIDAINAAGGVNGRQIELLIEDDASALDKATAAATKLIQQDQVTVMVGPFPPYEVPAIRQMCEDAQIPQIVYQPPSLAEMEQNTLKWSFTNQQTVRYNGSATAQILKEAGYKSIVVMHDSLPTYAETAQMVEEFATAAGISVTVAGDTWDVADTDVTPVATKLAAFIKNANPEAIVLETNVIHFPQIMKTLREQGIDLPAVGPPTVGIAASFMAGPEPIEGVVFPSVLLVDPSQGPDDWQGKAANVDFAARYLAAYNQPTDFFAGFGYDSAHILIEGLKGGGDDKAAIRDAIESITGLVAGNGTYTYSPDDHVGVHDGYFQWKVEGGKYVFVKQLDPEPPMQ